MAHDGAKTLRRSFVKAGAGVVGTMALASDNSQAFGEANSPAKRPNFIFVTTDGHRPDALSLNGNRIVQTPNFDRIGREGMRFRNSFPSGRGGCQISLHFLGGAENQIQLKYGCELTCTPIKGTASFLDSDIDTAR